MADRLKAPPRKARPLKGPGRLPNQENLLKKSPDELIRILNRFDIDPDLAAIERQAVKAYERLEAVIAEGREPDKATWDAIDKSIQTAMTQNLRKMAKAAIRNYRQAKLGKIASRFAWVTTGKANVCGSCEPRHGKIKTMRQWEALGLPGSSVLVCGQECCCTLVPMNATAKPRNASS